MKLKDYLNGYAEAVNKCITSAPKKQRFEILDEVVICDFCPICDECWKYRTAQRYNNNPTDCAQALERFIEVEV